MKFMRSLWAKGENIKLNWKRETILENFNSSYKLSLLASVFVPFSVFVDEQKKTLPMGRDRHSRHLKKCRYAGGNTQDTVSECLLIISLGKVSFIIFLQKRFVFMFIRRRRVEKTWDCCSTYSTTPSRGIVEKTASWRKKWIFHGN